MQYRPTMGQSEPHISLWAPILLTHSSMVGSASFHGYSQMAPICIVSISSMLHWGFSKTDQISSGKRNAVTVLESSPREAVGYDHLDLRVALHPSGQHSELVHVLFEECLAVGVWASKALAYHREKDGYSQLG